ncbi:gephyrin-like molybdotransferase Glp [Halorhodospira halophila]|uniref:Molybdopterin molybdenumtransferase n=1 Tax=Halorhodospira halophila (strain DSM 244 / SL1) TaxID=349124 RepID=A1WTM4_HALHL|nr:gephyrin-like molybdotransferase Glp [Halorhodospira halophila]ABM61036.1 molybdopterin molybdochelatase [Halorhodospira halophila SL1]MBK1730138.1 molybdopterin molybdenumtransferase MoeA [Halorhodospira halophila]
MTRQATQGVAGHDGPGLAVAEARRRILDEVAPLIGQERVALAAALGRVLAENVHAPLDVPGADNAAMDGYAVRSVDLPENGPGTLRVVDRVLAGAARRDPLAAGECVRIMTGAPIPPGADAVVMQERVEDGDDGQVRIPGPVAAGENIRRAGEDLAAGSVALAAGRRLRPQEVGVLGSLGRPEVTVHRRPVVAFLSTGDELCSPGQTPGPGQIYDSNRHLIGAALRRLGVDAVDGGVIGDDLGALKAAISEAGSYADAVITTGGVSVGEADTVKEALACAGDIAFWRVAMRPGRPLAFGRVGPALFFGLPGNPVSAAATFYQLVQPALRRLMGEAGTLQPAQLPVIAAERLRKRPGRMEFQRGILEPGADGTVQVRSTGAQGSGMLTSLVHADCLIVLDAERGDVAPGETVQVQPLEGLQR